MIRAKTSIGRHNVRAGRSVLTQDAEIVGLVPTTRYPGDSTSKYTASGRLTSGAPSALSVAFWGRPLSMDTRWALGEYTTSGNNRMWYMQGIVGKWDVLLSSDGTNVAYKQYRSATSPTTPNVWNHFCFTWGASTLTMYTCAVAETPTKLKDDAFANIFNGTANFTIGGIDAAANGWNDRLAHVVIEEATWSAATVANVKNGIIPATAWYWPRGDGAEEQQGFATMAKGGTPVERRDSRARITC